MKTVIDYKLKMLSISLHKTCSEVRKEAVSMYFDVYPDATVAVILDAVNMYFDRHLEGMCDVMMSNTRFKRDHKRLKYTNIPLEEE